MSPIKSNIAKDFLQLLLTEVAMLVSTFAKVLKRHDARCDDVLCVRTFYIILQSVQSIQSRLNKMPFVVLIVVVILR
jgi:hypothetical protein